MDSAVVRSSDHYAILSFGGNKNHCIKRIVLVFFFCSTLYSWSQTPRITLYGSHVTDLQVQHDLSTSATKTQAGSSTFQVGGGAEWLLNKQVRVELLYLHQSARANHSGAGNILPETCLDYVMAGAGDYFVNRHGKLNAFAGLLLGTSVIKPVTADNDRRILSPKLACGVRVAGNYWFSPSVGFKLETMMLFTQNAHHTSTFSAAPNKFSYTSVYQITLGAGLMFNL